MRVRMAAAAHSRAERRPKSAFITLRGGVNELVDALRQFDRRSAPQHRRRAHRGSRGYVLALADGSSLPVEAVILATPAFASAS